MRKHFISALAVGLVVTLASVALAAEGKSKPAKPDRAGKPDPAEIFKRVDADGDGKVSKEEFKKFLAFMASRRGEGKPEGKPEGKHPARPEGKPEGKGGEAGHKPPPSAAMAEQLFERLDGNKDGFLSQEEFFKMREMMGKPGGEKPRGKPENRGN